MTATVTGPDDRLRSPTAPAAMSGTRASHHLDLIRGVAAIAVVMYHVRYRFFLDYADVADKGPLAGAFYAATSFGHDAVMVFFVLSGFLIGSAVWRRLEAGTWRWREYVVQRGVRLLVVLLPGLLLTLAWDQAGLSLFPDHPIYSGQATGFIEDYFDVAARGGAAILGCNAVFLQMIACPPFGSNDALWSLSFEAWYYVLFPLLVLGLAAGRGAARLFWLVLAAATVWFIGPGMAWYFHIWLLGALVSRVPQIRALHGRPLLVVWAPAVAFVFILVASHLGVVRALFGNSVWRVDTFNAVVFAISLYLILHDSRPAIVDRYARVAATLASFSFTLYVVHLPPLVFLRAAFTPARPWVLDGVTAAWAAGLSGLMVVYAVLIARMTERHTPAVRRRVEAWLGKAPGRVERP